MRNKMIAMLLAAALAGTMLAGCGGTDTSDAGTADTQDVAAEAATTTEEAADAVDTEAAEEAATEADTEEAVEELTALEDITIEETTLCDNENVTITARDLRCSEDGAEVTVEVANHSAYELMVYARQVSVNGYMRDYGNSLAGSDDDYWYVNPGATIEETYELFDLTNDDDPTNYYAMIQDPQRIRRIELTFEAFSYNDYYVDDGGRYALYVDDMSEPVEIRTNIYDEEPEADAPEGTWLTTPGLENIGCSLEFVRLYETDDQYVWLFYVENQGEDVSLYLSDPVVNGTTIPSASPCYEECTVFGDQIKAYTYTAVVNNCRGYLVMPVSKSTLEAAGVTTPIAETTVTIGAVDWAEGTSHTEALDTCDLVIEDVVTVE